MYDDDVDAASSEWEVEIAEPRMARAWDPDEVTEPEPWTLEDLEDWLPAFAD